MKRNSGYEKGLFTLVVSGEEAAIFAVPKAAMDPGILYKKVGLKEAIEKKKVEDAKLP